MKNLFFALLAIIFLENACKSGLVTTSNGCYNLIQTADGQNKSGDYKDALANFNEIIKKCDAYDAKEKAYAGKAASLNGLQQYSDALSSANDAIKINKNSLEGYFEKANSEMGLGMNAEAKADLQTLISLTDKNRNTSDRATLYAKIAALESRQQQYGDAQTNINRALELDASNIDLYILQGDIYTASGNYNKAMDSYNQAITKGSGNGKAYKGKVESMIKMYQAKYATNNVSVLASKMSTSEKQNLCEAISSGLSKGMKDMNIELVQVAICK